MSDSIEHADEHFYKALDLFAQGKLAQAAEAYQSAIRENPRHAEAMHGLARVLQDLGRYDEAIEIAQRLIEIDPEEILPHTTLSILFQKKGMIPEAEAEANRARVLGWKQQLNQSKQSP